MEISKCATSAILAVVAAGMMLTDSAHARDLRSNGPVPGTPVPALNSVTATATTTITTTTMAHPAVSKTAAATATSGATPPAPIVRDHGPGGNADPCLSQHHCDQGSELKSLIAYYQNTPPTASFCAKGSPTGPCFQGFAYPDGTGHTKTFYIAFSSLGGNPLPGQMDKFLNAMKNAQASYAGPTYKVQGFAGPGTRTSSDAVRDHRH
jgi:hypothetical protein